MLMWILQEKVVADIVKVRDAINIAQTIAQANYASKLIASANERSQLQSTAAINTVVVPKHVLRNPKVSVTNQSVRSFSEKKKLISKIKY